MCTSISLFNPIVLCGRNMDLEGPFGEQVTITPRNYRFSFHKLPDMKSHFAMIGMANSKDGFPLYAEAVNEKGLYIAGLNFPDNAFYFPDSDYSVDETLLTPYELIPYILGRCETLAEARNELEKIRLLKIPFSDKYPLAPLHWHLADQTGSLVMEPMSDGLKIYDNPVGVLTNNPPFPHHLMNLHNHQALSPHPPENHFSSSLCLQPYGQGMEAIGLPGDFSPMSRFIKAAFLTSNTVSEPALSNCVVQFFHILDSVAMVRGSVITQDGNYDITTYSCCVDVQTGCYYYKTYDSYAIHAIHLFHENLDSKELITFSVDHSDQIHQVN